MRVSKYLFYATIACCIGVVIFLLMPSGLDFDTIYKYNEEMVADNKQESSKELFKEADTILDLKHKEEDGSGNSIYPEPDKSGGTSGSSPEAGDLLSIAKIVCAKFTYQGKYNYSQAAGSAGTILCNNKSIATPHRDCSCLVSAMLYFSGMESMWIHRSSGDFYNIKGKQLVADSKSNSTFQNVQVGDIIVKQGHVAMAVKRDEQYVYFADAGCTDAIEHTAIQGWDEKYHVTDSISKWRSGSIKVWRY